MPVTHNQKSFNAGEWAPDLYARVDLAKYHAAAALLRNFFVDYRGGASTRPGTAYVLQAYKSATAVRVIRFQASFLINYVLEFGDGYIRFFFNGAPVVETGKVPTAITQANPASVHSVAHGFSTSDWVFAQAIGGMTQLNGRYFRVVVTGADDFTLQAILDGSNINSTAYSAFTAGGTFSRVYTLASPWAAADLALVKFAQNVNTMVLTHPNYATFQLTLVAATNWTLVAVQYGASILPPSGVGVATTLGGGSMDYSYTVTAVDQNGQESQQATPGGTTSKQDLVTTASKTNNITWSPVSGAFAYNVYGARRLDSSGGASIPSGAAYGFVGSSKSTSFADTSPGYPADYTQTPPVSKNPFVGGSVNSYIVTAAGAYTTVPTVTVAAPPSGSGQATAQAVLQVQSVTLSVSGNGWFVGDIAEYSGAGGPVRLVVATVDAPGGHILTVQPLTFPGSNRGSITSGSTPGNPQTFPDITTLLGGSATFNMFWGVGAVIPILLGAAYIAAPAVTFSGGAAAATAVVTASGGNPGVPAYFQQRLVLAGANSSPQTFNMSRPGAYFNFDQSDPILPNDAIQGTLVSTQLNTIKHMISMPSGLIMLTSAQAWLVNGGGAGTPITPSDATASGQAFSGASDVPPILANADLLFVQSKGSSVRHLVFDFYKGVYTGTDISILSSHLFFGYTVVEWAFAEEPFKLVWTIRSDGTLLSLTFLKEQELIGWAHSDTAGTFKSVCCATEAVTGGNVDATYFVVQRLINGNTVKYIERLADRFWTTPASTWCVDAGLRYSGAPATTFSGGDHLVGSTIVGLADGVPITPFVMPASGTFTLAAPASVVTVGLAFTPQLQTLILDLGEPTVIGKLKKIIAVTVRAKDTLGIWFGRALTSVIPLKDFSGATAGSGVTLPYALTTDDARQLIDPKWDQDGQYVITQPNPLPATILGVVPEIKVEDVK